jgi:adenine-specific DNA-methyltransferase
MLTSPTINAGRKVALRKDKNYLHIMKYMGSKRELLPDIREEIEKISKGGDGVLDIFSGTCSVGIYLRDKYNIISNDIQQYSSIISDALICSCSHKIGFNLDKVLKQLRNHYNKNKEALIGLFPGTLEKSIDFVSTEKRGWDDKGRRDYINFMESFPSPLNKFKGKSDELNLLYDLYLERGERSNKFPYLQTAFLFSETYFSFEQCIDIDSIRYAIDKVFKNEVEKSIALCALIYAHSYSSSGTGHFAMFRDLKDVKSINDVFLYRDRLVWELFERKFGEIISFHRHLPEREYLSLSRDYEELLRDKQLANKYKVIYADPPYSFVHYSRFYHATESLIKYDYMVPRFKGRYRVDRHQSPFCQRQNVRKAFEILFESASENGKFVLLSYSDTGMISLGEILEVIRECGMKYRKRELAYDHSTMGREDHKSNQIKEYLIVVSPPSTN